MDHMIWVYILYTFVIVACTAWLSLFIGHRHGYKRGYREGRRHGYLEADSEAVNYIMGTPTDTLRRDIRLHNDQIGL